MRRSSGKLSWAFSTRWCLIGVFLYCPSIHVCLTTIFLSLTQLCQLIPLTALAQWQPHDIAYLLLLTGLWIDVAWDLNLLGLPYDL
jgi:hypothetical protein